MTTLVNGQRIETAEIQQEFERLLPYYQEHVQANDAEASDEQLLQWARENLMERILLQQESDKLPDPESERIDAAYEQAGVMPGHEHEDEIRNALATQIKIDQLIERLVADLGLPAEEELKTYYQANLSQFTMPEQRRASHIVRHVGPTCDEEAAKVAIDSVKAELDAGTEFEKLVSEHSDCDEGGGDLGYFARGKMVQEFEEVIFSMDLGQVSEPFLTPFGWHIAKLVDIALATTAPMEEVREQIVASLVDQQRTAAVEQYVDELKKTATIEDAK